MAAAMLIFHKFPSKEQYCAKPALLKNFLTKDECDTIITLAENLSCLSRSEVDDTKAISKARTSYTCFLSDDAHPLMKTIKDRVEQLTDIPQKYYEDLQIVRYRRGQEYQAHYDVTEGEPDKDLRQKTVLIYLNDDFEGGETSFEKAGVTVAPKKGMAVLWDNIDNRGEVLPCALHAASPVTKGTKYACTVWIRGFTR